MQIGELAKRLGVKADTLRFYEKKQILQASNRTKSGYRSYSEEDYRQAQFILRCKLMGFSLAEIKELLAIQINKSDHSCQQVKQQITDKREEIERRIAELQSFRACLVDLEHECNGGSESAESCPILKALAVYDWTIK